MRLERNRTLKQFTIRPISAGNFSTKPFALLNAGCAVSTLEHPSCFAQVTDERRQHNSSDALHVIISRSARSFVAEIKQRAVLVTTGITTINDI